jgi:photosystem II stability/assembly factor-like uncharacterized protein
MNRSTPLALILLAILLPMKLMAQQTGVWEIVDSTQSRYYVQDALANAGDDMVLVSKGNGISNLILRSTDGGANWSTLWDKTLNQNWYSVAHPTAELIVVVGDTARFIDIDTNLNIRNAYQGVFHLSTDGGVNWSGRSLDSNSRLTSVSMCDAQHGIMVKQPIGNIFNTAPGSLPDSILVTDDSWSSWHAVVLPPDVTYVPKVICFSPTTFFVFGYDAKQKMNLVYRTTDAGATWTTSTPLPSGLRDFSFIDPLDGWGAGSVSTGVGNRQRDVIARTTDGGMTWSVQLDREMGKIPFGLGAIAFADEENGIATGFVDKILRTRDGGKNWVEEYPPSNLPPSAGFSWAVYPRPDLAVAVNTLGPIIRYSGAQALAVPTFIKPESSGPLGVDSVLIEWTPISGAESYRVQVSPQSIDIQDYDPAIYDKHIIDTTLSGTQLVIRNLLYWNRYWVRIKAIGATSESDWSRDNGSSLFYTMKQGALLPPKILLPQNGATDQPTTVTVEWEPIAGATGYDIDLSKEHYFIIPSEIVLSRRGVTGTSIEVSGLEVNTAYYIRLRAHIGADSTDWTSQYAPHIFTTVATSSVGTYTSIGRLTMQVAPNPATDRMLVRLSRLPGSNAALALYDMLGQSVRRFEPAGERIVEIGTADLPAGNYLLRLVDGPEVLTQPVTVVR